MHIYMLFVPSSAGHCALSRICLISVAVLVTDVFDATCRGSGFESAVGQTKAAKFSESLSLWALKSLPVEN